MRSDGTVSYLLHLLKKRAALKRSANPCGPSRFIDSHTAQ
jgi:hypothetical protein